MRNHPENERIKRRYFDHLRHARCLSDASIDPVAQAINPPITNKPTPKKRSTAAKSPNEDVGDAVRSGVTVPNLKLSEVKKIYIEIRGDASNDLRTNIVESLNSSGLVAATNADEADAALKIVVSQTSTSAQLVNARGTVLWRGRSTVASDIVKDLLSEIRRARH